MTTSPKLCFIALLTLIFAFSANTSFAQFFPTQNFESDYFQDDQGVWWESSEDAFATLDWNSQPQWEETTNDWQWEFENTIDTPIEDTWEDWDDSQLEFTDFEPIEFEPTVIDTSFDWEPDFEFENPWPTDDDDTPPQDDGGDDDSPPPPPDDDDIDVPPNCALTAAQLAGITNFPPPSGPIVALGDSLTAGVGATPGQDYVSELERLTDTEIINAGISGDTTTEALNRLNEDVLSYNPATVIVWLGGNDFLARYYQELEDRTNDTFLERIVRAFFQLIGKDPRNDDVITESETFANLETIVERIQDEGAVVVLVGMDGDPVENNLNERYEEVAEDTGAIYVEDVLGGIIGNPSLSSDFVHPNNAGYELVARRIYQGVACTL